MPTSRRLIFLANRYVLKYITPGIYSSAFFALIMICFAVPATGQETRDSSGAFILGKVVVKGYQRELTNTMIDASRIAAFGKTDVGKALSVLPGVSLSAVGPRNESMIYVRGFDLRQVPVLIDGIPVYVPYDGYVDLARFTSFDLASISVSKGYTSVLYGPNALGGAINLVSRRPVNKFEFNGATGWLTGGYRTNINIGSNLGKFYVQAGASKMRRDYFALSKDFTAIRAQQGGDRGNSYSTDEKFNIKVAYTPNQSAEYALSYIYQHGSKGTPVYAGSDSLNGQLRNPRFWQWPYWDKQSLYFISNTRIDSTQYFKTRVYYDKFKNQLNSYDDASYSKISRPYAFESFYDDYSFGGIMEYGKTIARTDNIKASVQYKQDVHRENNSGEPQRTFSDVTFAAGLENELKLLPCLVLLTGVSYNLRSSIKANDYNSTTKQVSDFPGNTNNAVNIQGGLEYHPDALNSLRFSIARKTRFATVKDRYSYRLGTAIPNPDLTAEYAVNYDLSYEGRLSNKFNVQGSLFYSRVNNSILMVSNVRYDSTRRVWLTQLQNVGRSEYLGAEAGAEYRLTDPFSIGANYTFIQRHNLSNPALKFIDVPRHKIFAFVQYRLPGKLQAQLNTEYNSDRFSTSYGAATSPYWLLNATAAVNIWKWFSVEGGVNNMLDRNYALVEGYPEPGRNFFFNVVYRL